MFLSGGEKENCGVGRSWFLVYGGEWSATALEMPRNDRV